ncbi:uncharacterized protein LOC124260454 [Haliotis rubra]|uniref:uncharacterized protein LOC124260454 n=1 Tax=Haliotis rubra TaxID=36100 RepID=UPI001EE512EB|nr:uncharacterized protein LOC124260454 [Haliotis rubra]
MEQKLGKSYRDSKTLQRDQQTAEPICSLIQTQTGSDVDLDVSPRRQQHPQQQATNAAVSTTVLGDVNVAIGSGGGTMSSEATDWKIESTREVFVQTDSFQKVESKLIEHGHLTITGASGEGKTSMALMLGDKYKKKGFKLVFVDNIDKFDLAACVKDGQPLFIVFDDLFGTGSSAEISNFRKVLTSLDEFIKHLTRSSETKKMTRQQMKTGQGHILGLGGVRPDHDMLPQVKVKQHLNLYIVFTSKSYNFQEVVPRLGGQQFTFFKPQTVVDVTRTPLYQYSVAEKKAIFRKHQQSKGHDKQVDLDQICSSKDSLFGFPMTCSLYARLLDYQSDPLQFFLNLLTYLRQEIDLIMGYKGTKSAALILMVLYNEKLDLRKRHNSIFSSIHS